MEDLNTWIEIDLTVVCAEDICTPPLRYVPVPKIKNNNNNNKRNEQQQCKYYDDEEDKEQQTVQG